MALLGVLIVFIDGCYGVVRWFLMVLLGGCYGGCYGVSRWHCYGGFYVVAMVSTTWMTMALLGGCY